MMSWLVEKRAGRAAAIRTGIGWSGLVGGLGLSAALTFGATALAAPRVAITAPAQGAVVPGPDVTVTIEVNELNLVPAAQARNRDDLHVHYLLDVDPKPFLDGQTAVPTGNPKIIHSAAISATFTGLAAGPHRVTVIPTYANHVALEPVISAQVDFQVGAAPRGGAGSGALPQAGGLPPLVGAGAGLAVAVLGAGWSLRRWSGRGGG